MLLGLVNELAQSCTVTLSTLASPALGPAPVAHRDATMGRQLQQAAYTASLTLPPRAKPQLSSMPPLGNPPTLKAPPQLSPLEQAAGATTGMDLLAVTKRNTYHRTDVTTAVLAQLAHLAAERRRAAAAASPTDAPSTSSGPKIGPPAGRPGGSDKQLAAAALGNCVEVLDVHLHNFPPRQLAQCVAALGHVGVPGRRADLLTRAVRILLGQDAELLRSAGPAAAAQVADGMARLQHADAEAWQGLQRAVAAMGGPGKMEAGDREALRGALRWAGQAVPGLKVDAALLE